MKERDYRENLSTDGTKVLKRTLKNTWQVEGWINVAQETDRGRAVVNTVMSLQFPLNAGNKYKNIVRAVGSEICVRNLGYSK